MTHTTIEAYKADYPALIRRINQLAKKKREEGLTSGELAEQKELYAIYLGGIRAQLTGMLDSIEVVDGPASTAEGQQQAPSTVKILR